MDFSLMDLLTKLWDMLKSVVVWACDVVSNIFHSTVNWIYDKALDFLAFLMSGLDLTPFTSLFHWAGLPPQMVYVLQQVGMDSCLTMLSSALLVRIGLNLIPSWLTRV